MELEICDFQPLVVQPFGQRLESNDGFQRWINSVRRIEYIGASDCAASNGNGARQDVPESTRCLRSVHA
jgi:hypothetical protein